MNLIVFCDGTWNTPDQMDGDLSAPTNVVKLRNALATHDADGEEQKVYYHPGVGTDGGWWDRIAGGGMGEGLDRNIMSAYNWLARQYTPKAKIWLFGFSRGAYTARSLGGMISRCGLFDPASPGVPKEADIWRAIQGLFDNYRLPADQAAPIIATDTLAFHGVATGQTAAASIPIHFIGVWDTVGALGVPDDMALLNLIDDPKKHSFHDTTLGATVAHARHAVAIDEMRQSFMPTLWDAAPSDPRVKQVWFPGVHGDVGGGYGLCGLSNAALLWMADEAEAKGLGLRAAVRDQMTCECRDQLHDSLTGIFKTLKTRPRAVPCLGVDSADLHASARDRHTDPPLQQGAYWKTMRLADGEQKTVDIYAREHWNSTGLWLEAGVDYIFSASGEWLDGGMHCGPDGTDGDGQVTLGDAVQMASSFFGRGEAIYKRLTGNRKADFIYTKREEDFGWFQLVGLVANGVVPDHDAPADTPPHEVFAIGTAASFTPGKSGYLYAFANDAWQMYDNNAGSVQLTVRRG
ncbi:DUF2235 domain-containing protein [Rhizobium halophytocola]|uniref:Uncharacterized protein (DUF2235 family) n=1 Tax=Rhizobium halophytocola TaxID=735519 RepID=A0ABS4E5Q7_9HYPH|nr:DUF2235 domain-containing protein [Rhizobium halophytocola]MBP1853234.1 uncharacterized protein (DUF2235 family) [Rhizobium halophytocola]